MIKIEKTVQHLDLMIDLIEKEYGELPLDKMVNKIQEIFKIECTEDDIVKCLSVDIEILDKKLLLNNLDIHY
ncbi:MAG: hypothetical protein V3V33_16575 [Candidatus Lokiarchaeia archaeon]